MKKSVRKRLKGIFIAILLVAVFGSIIFLFLENSKLKKRLERLEGIKMVSPRTIRPDIHNNQRKSPWGEV